MEQYESVLKCPFRETKKFTKKIVRKEQRDAGGFQTVSQSVPCTESESEFIDVVFQDCYKRLCPYFTGVENVGEFCSRVK